MYNNTLPSTNHFIFKFNEVPTMKIVIIGLGTIGRTM